MGRSRFLSCPVTNDQETRHLPSIYLLIVGLVIRLTENVDREKQLYRDCQGIIYRWTTMVPGCILAMY